MKKLLFGLIFALFGVGAAHAVDYPFSVTTSEIAANGTFQFMLSAQGTFYVDCGSGGTLSSDDSTANAMISGGTITKNDTVNYTFKCTYSTASTKTIRFGGLATGYTVKNIAAISFNTTNENSELISSISGNISVIFPYLGSGSGQAPKFWKTFFLVHINSIPETLFANYIGDLSGATYMFYATFSHVFHGHLTQIPANLFSGITAGAPLMFVNTFRGCIFLTSIPENLFSNITNSAEGMFYGTFEYSGLTSLPEHLFSNITTSAPYMFQRTFADCRNLGGYVPKSMFAGLIANNSPYATDMMTGIFGPANYNYGAILDNVCPSGTTQFTTGYESYWGTGNGNAVSCEPNTLNVNWYNGNTQLTVPSASQSCTYGDTFSLPTPPAAPNGYHFGGWKVKAQ